MSKKITDLQPQKKNMNKHTEHGERLLRKTVQQYGIADGITVAANDEAISGSLRIETLADMMPDVKIQIVETYGDTLLVNKRMDIPTPDTKTGRALSVASNQVANTDYNPDGELLKEWGNEDKDIKAMFAESEWEEITGEEKPVQDAEPQIDRAAELLEKWKVKTGDLWMIGKHRLICGDCTDPAVVARVMGGEKAGACVTDSPYGINREGIENDDPEGLRELFDGCLAVMPIENGVIINFQSPRLFPVWLDALKAAGHLFKRALWMYDENDQTKPWHYWLMCSQIAIISTLGKPEWLETKGHHDTYVIGLSKEWRAGGDGNDFAHASVKPVGVVQDVLGHIGGDVYEPFSGSGTTLVACQNLGRRGRAIEISPAYVSVALQRMQDAFGITGVLIK